MVYNYHEGTEDTELEGQRKHFISLMHFFNHLFSALCMRIGDKKLPEIFIVHQRNQMLNPGFVQFIKNIIQSQNGVCFWICFLFTSDAADDIHCVDIGGARVINKKIENTTK